MMNNTSGNLARSLSSAGVRNSYNHQLRSEKESALNLTNVDINHFNGLHNKLKTHIKHNESSSNQGLIKKRNSHSKNMNMPLKITDALKKKKSIQAPLAKKSLAIGDGIEKMRQSCTGLVKETQQNNSIADLKQ